MKAPDHYVYRDWTGHFMRGPMMGGLLGLALGAASEGPGHHRFDAVASKNPIDIKTLMQRHMEAALKASPMKVVSANGDTTLSFEIGAYGVGPVNGRELGGVVAATATLVDRDGKTIWKKDEWANSTTTSTLEGLEQNPKLWPRMIDEAVDAFAKKLVLVTEKQLRHAPDPLM